MDFIIDQEFRKRNRPQTKAERLGLKEMIDRDGCAEGALICGQVEDRPEVWLIDGHNTVEICEELGKPTTAPRLLLFKDRQEILEWIDKKQEGRRNLTAEQLEERVAARRERIQAARADGQSIRSIAEDEGVAVGTVAADLLCDRCRRVGKTKDCQACQELTSKKTSGVQGRTPGPKKPPKITGLDGKVYSGAKLPKPRKKKKKATALPADAAKCPTCGRRVIPKAERGALFAAVAKVAGADMKTAASHIGKVVTELLAAEPSYTPEEVAALPAAVKKRGMSFTLTLGCLTKYIGWVRVDAAMATVKLTPKEAAEFNRLERQKAGIE